MKQNLFTLLLVFFLFANAFGKQVGVYTPRKEMGVINTMHYCFDVAGFPVVYFSNTDSLSKDIFDIIFLAARPTNMSDAFASRCEDFVSTGGILFGDRESVSSSKRLLPIFGLSGINRTDVHYRININTEEYPYETRWLDDDVEKWFLLCREDKTFYNVNELIPDEAHVMATYEDGTVAMTEHIIGGGMAYCIGPNLKHILLFPRMNKDLQAHRIYSNGFEPAADIFPLLIRGIVETYVDDAAWKYTIPTDAEGVVCITHDMDSKTGFIEGGTFADYEQAADIVGQYNITTRYFRDNLMSAFYINTNGKEFVNYVLDRGHIVSSHSVGHFYDMNEFMPLNEHTKETLSQETYNPFHLFSNGKTIGGSIYGEALVSKQILERDGAPVVNSIRTGHLCFPKHLPEVLEDCGYLYSSCLSANDILTGFPLKLIKTLSSSNPLTNVVEVPMHLSDVFRGTPIAEDNWPDKVEIWLEATKKYTENHVPVVLLIHPNTQWKRDAQQRYFQHLSQDVDVLSFIDIAEFWSKRYEFTWTSSVSDDDLTIEVPDSLFPIDERMRIMLPNGEMFNSITVRKESGDVVPHSTIPHRRGLLLEFREAVNSVQFIIESDSGYINNAVISIAGNSLLDSLTNANGKLDIDSLLLGEQEFAIRAEGYSDFYGTFIQERKSFVSVRLSSLTGENSQIVSKMYPLPAIGRLTVEVANRDRTEMTFYNLYGTVVKTVVSASTKVNFSVEDIKSGYYLMHVENRGRTEVYKILIL